MAVTISKLAVILSANTAKFDKSLQAATARTTVFGVSVKKIGVAAGKAFKGITIAAAAMATAVVASLVAITKAGFASVDALAKTGARLNISTRALAEFQFAGKLAGVEVRTLDMALQRMTRRISEAAIGTGEAKDAIKELGLDAGKLGAMRLDEQFRAIVEAWGGVAERNKVRLAFKLFDSEGVKLINLLNMGAESLDIASAKARRFGLSVSEIDAAAVEQANDAWTGIRSALEGIGRQLAVKTAPFLTKMADEMERFADASKVADSIFRGGVTGTAFLAEVGNSLAFLGQGVKTGGALAGETLALAESGTFDRNVAKLEDIIANRNPAARIATSAINTPTFLARGRANAARGGGGFTAPVRAGRTRLIGRAPLIEANVPALNAVAGDVKEIVEAVREQTSVVESVKATVEQFNESLRVSAATAAATMRNAQMAGALLTP